MLIFIGVLFTQTACDLKPKIQSLPDSVGDFISARYPALLADPNLNPEIYNSAVTDYGVYASPELYGSDSDDDYVLYSSLDDYVAPSKKINQVNDDESASVTVTDNAQDVTNTNDYLVVPMYGGADKGNDVSVGGDVIVVGPGDTLYKLAKEHNTTVEELAKLNDIKMPYTLGIGQKLKLSGGVSQQSQDDVLSVSKPGAAVRSVTKVGVKNITVGAGDTLYSLSRRYSVPVNDLAVMNNLKPPFALAVGQKLRVPNLEKVEPVVGVETKVKISEKSQKPSVYTPKQTVGVEQKNAPQKNQKDTAKKVADVKPVKKISSDPTKKLPKINARSSSKFSWPVQGKILSNYGAKSNGLFNDGINISAKRGSAVKAAENGVVAYAGNEVKGMGNLIIIQHAGGWMTVYAHMDSMSVRRGTRVNVGQKIGTVGETGKVDSPQLHFEIRKGTKAYNPTSYLKK